MQTLADLIKTGVDIESHKFIVHERGSTALWTYQPKLSHSKLYCDWGIQPGSNGPGEWILCSEIFVVETL